MMTRALTVQTFLKCPASLWLWAILGVTAAMAEVPLGHKDFYPSPARPVGWRADGTGAWPAATPVTTSDGTSNVAWKTPLPSFGHGAPVAVGDRVFVMCDEGFKSDAPLLVCVNAKDGKIPLLMVRSGTWTNLQKQGITR